MLCASLLLWLALFVCYWRRPDSCAAITLWPVWAWALIGLLVTGLAWDRRAKRAVGGVALLWLLFLVVFAEEPSSLVRFGAWPDPDWVAARQQGRGLRVVSLNCSGGSAAAAAEVARYHPDIVLLQESPSRENVRALGRRLFGSEAGVVWGIDGSIIARGRARQIPAPRDTSILTMTHVRLSSRIEANVISVRLVPPEIRIDLWSPSCWRDHAANRRARRGQVAEAMKAIEGLPRSVPLIVGGDLNAPAGDAAFWPLRRRLKDTFREAGKGWGNTVLNDAPALRFDQVWASDDLRACAVVARKTRHSDHRMVICDLVIRDRRKKPR